MKRREFIFNSLITLCGVSFLSACGTKKQPPPIKGQVVRRMFRDLSIPLLGFGCMRLLKTLPART